jgi:hypothetical protein
VKIDKEKRDRQSRGFITDGWKEKNSEKGNVVCIQCTSDSADG